MALDWLERAYELRAPTLIWMRANPAWDPIREDPRFLRIVERMGLAGG
ncbi:MAG: TPR end-of-group domain-containing protein [Myxococcota bacterium]